MNSMSTMKLFCTSKNQQYLNHQNTQNPRYLLYVNHQNAKYLRVSTVRQPSNYFVLQRINHTLTIKILTILDIYCTSTIKTISISEYQQYVSHDYFVHQSINTTSTIEILRMSEDQRQVSDKNILYVKVSTVHLPSKYKASNSINGTSAIKICSISKYQQ